MHSQSVLNFQDDIDLAQQDVVRAIRVERWIEVNEINGFAGYVLPEDRQVDLLKTGFVDSLERRTVNPKEVSVFVGKELPDNSLPQRERRGPSGPASPFEKALEIPPDLLPIYVGGRPNL
ncbi:MAG: hypothetical protein ACRD1T_23390 [Acidimicrobiia bacterium]